MVELLVSINIYETRTAFWSDICRSEIHPELRHQCAARIFNSLAAWPPGAQLGARTCYEVIDAFRQLLESQLVRYEMPILGGVSPF